MSLATDLDILQVLKEIRDLLKAQAPAKPVEPFIPPDINKLTEYLKTTPQLSTIGERCVDGGSHRYDGVWGSITPQPCSKCGKTVDSMVILYNTDMTPKG